MKESPLLVVLHGYTSSADKIMDYSGMNGVAAKNGFAVLYPQGTHDNDSNTFWNVGYDFHSDRTVDDVTFIVQLSKFIQQKYNHSATDVFLTGMSNGAEMCYLIATRYPESFRAIAPVAGMMLSSFFVNAKKQAIPVFATFGTHDDVTRFEGDPTNADGWGAYQSIPETIIYWRTINKCNNMSIDTLPDFCIADSSYIIRHYYSGNENVNDVLFYEIVKGGHEWPGAWGNRDVNISEDIWRFFASKLE
jgi:polyhydroxybutyrate depolymerase